MDNANSQTYEGYSWVTDALIGYEKKGFEISLDFQNILNSKYAMEVTRDTNGVIREIWFEILNRVFGARIIRLRLKEK